MIFFHSFFRLSTGLFACSQALMKELTLFQRTRRHPIALDANQRLQKTLRHGQRKYPPHQVHISIYFRRKTDDGRIIELFEPYSDRIQEWDQNSDQNSWHIVKLTLNIVIVYSEIRIKWDCCLYQNNSSLLIALAEKISFADLDWESK